MQFLPNTMKVDSVASMLTVWWGYARSTESMGRGSVGKAELRAVLFAHVHMDLCALKWQSPILPITNHRKYFLCLIIEQYS